MVRLPSWESDLHVHGREGQVAHRDASLSESRYYSAKRNGKLMTGQDGECEVGGLNPYHFNPCLMRRRRGECEETFQAPWVVLARVMVARDLGLFLGVVG